MVAPSSFAAFFRSCSALARSESSWIFCESRAAPRWFLKFRFYAAANLLEAGAGRRLYVYQLKHRKALGQLYLLRGRLRRNTEQGIHELGRAANAGQGIGARHEIGGDDRKAFGGGSFVQPAVARLIGERAGLGVGGLRGFLLLDERLDLIFDFVQRLGVSVLLIVHADDMEPVTALHQIAGGAPSQRKCGFLKLRNRAASSDPTQRAAVFGAT